MAKKKTKVTQLNVTLPAATKGLPLQAKPVGVATKQAPSAVAWPQPLVPAHPKHRGAPVQVGPHTILAGGTRDLVAEDLEQADLLVPLLNEEFPPFMFGRRYQILAAPMQDYGGVPACWKELLETVIEELKAGKRVLAFCMGSHGRTGCFLASLIALLEPETEDPIAAARERHCFRAVESLAQAEAIFALRGEALPQNYKLEFALRIPAGLSTNGLGLGGFPWEK